MLALSMPAVASQADSVENTSRIGRPQENPSASIKATRRSSTTSLTRSLRGASAALTTRGPCGGDRGRRAPA